LQSKVSEQHKKGNEAAVVTVLPIGNVQNEIPASVCMIHKPANLCKNRVFCWIWSWGMFHCFAG